MNVAAIISGVNARMANATCDARDELIHAMWSQTKQMTEQNTAMRRQLDELTREKAEGVFGGLMHSMGARLAS